MVFTVMKKLIHLVNIVTFYDLLIVDTDTWKYEL